MKNRLTGVKIKNKHRDVSQRKDEQTVTAEERTAVYYLPDTWL